jgi:hypothetical protein
MQEQALSIIHRLPEHVQLLVLEKLMPQGQDALRIKAYADSDISKLLIVDKRIRNLIKGFINSPALLWGPQLRRILDTLGFEELKETWYLRGFDESRSAITPKQLALSIINFNYQGIAIQLSRNAQNDLIKAHNLPKLDHPIIFHLNCLRNLEVAQNNPETIKALALDDFELNIKKLNDTLPPIFLALTQLHYLVNKKESYQNLRDELLNSVKKKLPEITIDDNFLQELSLSLLLWPNAKKMLTINPDHFKESTTFEKPFLLAQLFLDEEAGDEVINYLNKTSPNQDIQQLFNEGLLCSFVATYNCFKKIFPDTNIQGFVAEETLSSRRGIFIDSKKAKVIKNCSSLVGTKNLTLEMYIKCFFHLQLYKWHILFYADYTKWKDKDLIEFLDLRSKVKQEHELFLYQLSPIFLHSFLGHTGDRRTMRSWINTLCIKKKFIRELEQMRLTEDEYNIISTNMELAISVADNFTRLAFSHKKNYLLHEINRMKKETTPTEINTPPSNQNSLNTNPLKRRMDQDSSSTSSKSPKFFDNNNNRFNNSTDEIYKFSEIAKQAKTNGNLATEQTYLKLLQTKLNSYFENSSPKANEDLPKSFSCK